MEKQKAYTMTTRVAVVWENEHGMHSEVYGNERQAMERVHELRDHFGREAYIKGVRRRLY